MAHKSVKVQALKEHTFRGKLYAEGESYAVTGDDMQTTDQYLDTLRATGLAMPKEDDAPQADEKPAGDTTVEPLSTDAPKEAEEPKAPKAEKSKRTKNAAKTLKKK